MEHRHNRSLTISSIAPTTLRAIGGDDPCPDCTWDGVVVTLCDEHWDMDSGIFPTTL